MMGSAWQSLITVASGIGRDTHTRFSESKPQRNEWTEESRLSARAGRSGVATSPTVERSKPRQRTVREPVTRRVVVGWRSRRRWNRGLRRGTITVVRDHELTEKAETRNASGGLSNTDAAEVEH